MLCPHRRFGGGDVLSIDYYGLMLPIRFLACLLLAAAVSAPAQPLPGAEPAPLNSEMDSDLFYQLLLGELHAQGEDPGQGYSLLLDSARDTGDARLYQRVTEIALQARAIEPALQAVRAWLVAHPRDPQANRYHLQILISLDRIAETVEPMRRLIAAAGADDRANVIAQLPRYFARVNGKQLAAQVLEQALEEHLKSPATAVESWVAIGRMRLEAGEKTLAMEAVRQAHGIDPHASSPALLALALMAAKHPPAEAHLQKFLNDTPHQPEVRMAYARVLLDAQRYAQAYTQIRQITVDKPDVAEAWLLRGTLELEDKRLPEAEQSIKRYVSLTLTKEAETPNGPQNRALAQAYLALANIAEQQRDFTAAEQWLSHITSSEDMVRAQSRRAGLLAKQGRLEEGLQLLRDLPERTPADGHLKLSAEVQLLRDHKQYPQAYRRLNESLARFPKDVELMYELATLAEKLGHVAQMERLLRRIMVLKPDFHHAYNALGYSLADRNVRLNEARQLILKALEYAPGDPFITDSLGWVEFRRGNLAESLRLLQTAYKAKPDAEIAAHLGEVLWAMDQHEQALGVWREGLHLNAENETLVNTLKRLRIKL